MTHTLHIAGYVALGYAVLLCVGAAHACALASDALIARSERWLDARDGRGL